VDEDIASRVYAHPLPRWFVTEACKIADTGHLMATADKQQVNTGTPNCRLTD
jgi:hypothetical protein